MIILFHRPNEGLRIVDVLTNDILFASNLQTFPASYSYSIGACILSCGSGFIFMGFIPALLWSISISPYSYLPEGSIRIVDVCSPSIRQQSGCFLLSIARCPIFLSSGAPIWSSSDSFLTTVLVSLLRKRSAPWPMSSSSGQDTTAHRVKFFFSRRSRAGTILYRSICLVGPLLWDVELPTIKLLMTSRLGVSSIRPVGDHSRMIPVVSFGLARGTKGVQKICPRRRVDEFHPLVGGDRGKAGHSVSI